MTSTDTAHQPNREFMHHVSDGCACAVCGSDTRPLAMQVLQRSYARDASLPKGFLVTAMSVDAMRGVFPVCDQCAPLCPTCGLPAASAAVLKFKKAMKTQYGKGVCPQHGASDTLSTRLKAIFSRALKFGRN